MSRLNEATVLVTGGARGLGKLIARGSIERQAGQVILWDIDEPKLGATADELRDLCGNGTSIGTDRVDLSDVDQIQAGVQRLYARHPAVDLLFNNAGIVVGKRFDEHTTAEIEQSIRINVLAAMHVARAFLPAMIKRRRGHIVNIASAAGLTPNPNMSVYTASKWAVLGWSESLRLELESTNDGVRVTTVCPSYIDTGMFDGARAPLLTPFLSPDAAVAKILQAVESNRILVRTPAIVNLLPVLRGLLPARWFDRLIGRGFRIYNSMDRHTGRAARP
jgi:all-trans-retinol dehydrogenase (NAD+)